MSFRPAAAEQMTQADGAPPSPLEVIDLRYKGCGPFSFVIQAGSCLGLSGPSGAGKSMLLRAIADLEAHEGELRIEGQSCLSMPAPLWRRLVAMLPSESGWWEDSVGSHFDDNRPLNEIHLSRLGFDRDVLFWPVSRLSTGEKQRLAIIRLLHNRPRALLLDEPTASLDADNIARTESLLRDYWLTEQVPVLLVSHDTQQLARLADRRMIMTLDGSLAMEGERLR